MVNDVSRIVDELNGIATVFEQYDAVQAAVMCNCEYNEWPDHPFLDTKGKELGPHPWPDGVISVRVTLVNCRMVLKINAHSESIKLRAEKLIKQGRTCNDIRTKNAKECSRALKWKPSLSRPKKYNRQVAQKFLDDGERDNWKAYRDLFD